MCDNGIEPGGELCCGFPSLPCREDPQEGFLRYVLCIVGWEAKTHSDATGSLSVSFKELIKGFFLSRNEPLHQQRIRVTLHRAIPLVGGTLYLLMYVSSGHRSLAALNEFWAVSSQNIKPKLHEKLALEL